MTSVAPPVIRIHPADDVVIARVQLLGGTRIDSEGITVAGLVPPGHKLAVRAIAAGPAGAALQPGDRHGDGWTSRPASMCTATTWSSATSRATTRWAQGVTPTQYVAEPATFQGIVRPDGRVATRNYIGVLTSVNCSATVARAIADHFRRDIHPRGAGSATRTSTAWSR